MIGFRKDWSRTILGPSPWNSFRVARETWDSEGGFHHPIWVGSKRSAILSNCHCHFLLLSRVLFVSRAHMPKWHFWCICGTDPSSLWELEMSLESLWSPWIPCKVWYLWEQWWLQSAKRWKARETMYCWPLETSWAILYSQQLCLSSWYPLVEQYFNVQKNRMPIWLFCVSQQWKMHPDNRVL